MKDCSGQPKYQQMKIELLKKIRIGAYLPGMFLPSESELMECYKVGRNTVRAALGELAAEGYVEKHRGQASRVCAPRAARKGKKANRIAWLDLDRIVNPLYFEVFKEVSSYAIELGYAVDYISVMNSVVLEHFLKEQDSYLGSLYSNVPDIHLPKSRMQQLYELPNLIGIDQNSTMLSDSYVLTDNAAGASMAVEYLLKQGHRKILYFASLPSTSTYPPFLTRQLAIRETLQKNGIEYDPAYELVLSEKDAKLNIRNIMKKVLSSQKVDAIITNSDSWAITTLFALRSIGVKVPDDISLIGFDGWWASGQTIPSLTTIRQPAEKIARSALDLLLRRVGRKNPLPEQILIKPELIIRDSVKKLSKKT